MPARWLCFAQPFERRKRSSNTAFARPFDEVGAYEKRDITQRIRRAVYKTVYRPYKNPHPIVFVSDTYTCPCVFRVCSCPISRGFRCGFLHHVTWCSVFDGKNTRFTVNDEEKLVNSTGPRVVILPAITRLYLRDATAVKIDRAETFALSSGTRRR